MRPLLVLALASLCACSYPAEKADVVVQVSGIPRAADHLNVIVTPADPAVPPKDYHPAFQPDALPAGTLELDLTDPAPAGSFTVAITADDRNQSQLAAGSVSGTLPGPLQLAVTLH